MEVIVKNTYDKKLKRDYSITIPYALIHSKIDDYVAKAQKKFALKGFRKGQVPVALIKEKYGESIMADEADKIISDTIQKIIKDNNFKLAIKPKVDIKTFEITKDIELATTIELYPKIPEIELGKIKIISREVEITPEEIDLSTKNVLKFYRKWNKKETSYKAKLGDSVVIDYVGKIDKEEFEGGSAKGYQLELGSKNFIDDFEEQLVGKKAGEEVKVKVKFPKEYHDSKYSGKAAEFAVKIQEVLLGELPEITDEFIKNTLGIESRAKFDEIMKKQTSDTCENMNRNLFKKELFDFLNKKFDFELPISIVDEQLEDLWKEVEEEIKKNPDKFKNDKEKERAKEKKRELAERMIRCGMILSDLAQKNKIEVTKEDISNNVRKIIANFPGRENEMIELFNKNPETLQRMSGPIIEEKVISFILQLPSIPKKKISFKELEKIWNKEESGS